MWIIFVCSEGLLIVTLVLSDAANGRCRLQKKQPCKGKGRLKERAGDGSAYFLKYHSRSSNGFCKHRVCQSGSDSKALCRGTLFFFIYLKIQSSLKAIWQK